MKLSISLAVASFLATLTAAYPNPSPASEARMPPTMRPILEARDTTAYHYPSPASEARMPPTMRPVLEPRDTAVQDPPALQRFCKHNLNCLRVHRDIRENGAIGRKCHGQQDCAKAYREMMNTFRIKLGERGKEPPADDTAEVYGWLMGIPLSFTVPTN